MADTSSNATTPQLADIPSIQSFQFEADPVGQIRKSVNLFRGDVNLPLELVNLKADHGLTASATAVYDGSACHHVDIWNLDAPTGILGLGWSLPMEQIIASRTGAASDQLTSYYLRAAGAASEMIHTGTDADGSLLFQLQAYQFWRIRYYETQQRWEITKEDGTKSIYGGSTVPGTSDGNSVQWGVAFGNWMISSAQTLGQSQIPVAWNLRQVVSTHGHAITYTYDVVTQAVGSGGKSYTKACYLSSITESGGRSIVFSYGEKIFQPGQLCEYQDPHKQTPNNNPDGYQSCYATRFLDQIAVRAADGTPLTSVVFSYSFFNTASNSNPAHPFLYKRILTAIHLRNERLDPLPGMVFTYNQPGEIAPGRLKTVEYPQGATATYGYHTLNLPSMRQQRILNPFTGSTPGVPRVWHGPDYSVITWVDTVGNRLQVSTYSWSGSWVDWTPASIQNAKVDLSSLLVAATENYFAVFYRDIQTSQGMLLLYQRDPTAFGTWTETVLSKPMKSGTATSTFAVGDDFVVVANPLFTGGAFMGAWWDWTKRAWSQPLLPSLPLATTPQVAIAGFGNFYVACSYDASRQLGSFQLISVSGHAWTSRSWSNTMAVLQAGSGFPFEWSLLPSGAVATYLTSMSASSATGQMMTFQWDVNYNPISPSTPVTQALNTPVANGQLVVNILATQSVGAMVGNGASLTRYVGGGASTNWAAHALDSQISASSSYQFAYGLDAAVMVKSSGGASAAVFSGFNPNIPNAAGWSQNITVPQASAATVGDGYATIGGAIYQRQTDGHWIQTGTLMAASGRNLDPASVQNRAPSYIAYQDAGGTNTLTYIALIRNGVVQPAITLAPDPQCVTVHGAVGAGTDLAGPLAFVTYPAGSSFDAAPYLTLYRVVDRAVSGAVTDTPVTTINIGNGFDDQINPPLLQAYQYNTAGMTLDSTTGVAQYPMVSMYGGTDSPAGRSPYGRTDFYYSNGLSTAAQAFYPAGWIYNYARILNGTLLATIARDADGKVLSTDIDYYQIFYTVRGSQFLYGAYPRAVQRSMTRDGVQTISQSQYDQQSGLATLVTTRSYLGGAVERVYEQHTTYAYQVPEYASAMLGAWVLNSVAQVVMTSDAAPVSGKVTTFKNWTTDSEWRWAAERSYTWTGTGTASFDFGPNQPNANWTLDRTILARTASGRIAARADATGLVTSYQFDKADHFQVAAFTNANALAGEAAYLGFEPYEPTAGWTIGTGATMVSGDAHAGHYALSVPHGTTGLSRGFTATRGDLLLVAWVKTSRGFGRDGGTARWDFNIDGVSGSVAITDTAQAWAPIVARLALPPGKTSASVAISCVNAKQTASFMVDDVRVGPFVGGFAARALDTDRRLVTARLDGPLATRKFLYDSYNSRIAALGPEAASASAQQLSFDVLSRETQVSDSFNPAQPNASTTIATSGASAYLDLAAGVPLAAQYVANPAASWSVTGDAVSYSGGAAGSLVAADATLTAPCAFRFTVASAAALKSALSIGLTSAGTSTASVSFDPNTASYTLAIGTRTLGTRKTPVLSLPSSAVTALDAGQVTPAIIAVFTARGWPLSATATVRTRTAKSSWTITDAASAKVYYVVAAGGGLDVSVLAREWTLTAGTRSLLFFADGILLFGVPTDAMLAGVPCLSAGDPLTFANLIVTRRPQTATTYNDGTGRKIQSQSVHDATAIAQQSVYDAVGNMVAQTKSTAIPATGRMLLAYAADYVSAFDRVSGVMQGLVADGHPEDQGYPYSGNRFEASPLARQVEGGRAGKDFAINLAVPVDQRHTTKYEYGANNGNSGLPANQYYTTTTISPRGIRSTAYVDKAARAQIGKTMNNGPGALQTFFQYDPAGNISIVRTPNYYAPGGSKADDWVLTFTYDCKANILSQTTPNEGRTQFVYDQGGRLRFTCDAEGAAKGYIIYNKYDGIGRPIETGYFETAFDRQTLQANANTQPDWPPSTTWQKRTHWDGDGTVPTTIGQLASCETANAIPGTADVAESFGYDISGRVLAKTSSAGGRSFAFAYAYDAIGNVVSLAYPPDSGVGIVTYSQDDLNRIVSVGTRADPAAYSAYRYSADGNVDAETFQPTSTRPITRAIGHNAPGWISGITATQPGGGSIFKETITYTSGGWPNGQGYYDGPIAELDFDYPDAAGAYTYRLNYDAQGQLLGAKDVANDAYDYGIASPVVYDANGNIRGTSVGRTVLGYEYASGAGDRLQTVTASEPALRRSFGYDANGNITGVSGGRTQTIAYDRATDLPRTVTTGNTTVVFAYDGRGRRITRASSGLRKVYGYGTSPQALVEWIGTAGAPTSYIYGPAGLMSVTKGGILYFVFRDHERSPRVLCGTDGRIAASFDYMPFGSVSREYGDASLTDRRFTGQEYDAETGLYNYGSRLYDAAIGRFYAPDPQHQFFSPYLYAANNPLSFVDPTGQFAIIAALVEGIADLIVFAAVSAEATEVATTTVAATTTIAEGSEAVAVGTETVSTVVGATEEVAATDSLVAASTDATTTNLSEISTVSAEAAEVENGSVTSLESTAQSTATRYYSPIEWLNFRGDLGGQTAMHPVPYARWPLTYLNQLGLTAYNPVVTVFDMPGTFGYVDTAAHEGFHALIASYLPFITQAGNASIGGVQVGGPVLWAEETVAYSVGHLAAGRVFAVPFAPIEAFGSMSGPQGIVTLGAMVVGAVFFTL